MSISDHGIRPLIKTASNLRCSPPPSAEEKLSLPKDCKSRTPPHGRVRWVPTYKQSSRAVANAHPEFARSEWYCMRGESAFFDSVQDRISRSKLSVKDSSPSSYTDIALDPVVSTLASRILVAESLRDCGL
jgi:hypothetical protein